MESPFDPEGGLATAQYDADLEWVDATACYGNENGMATEVAETVTTVAAAAAKRQTRIRLARAARRTPRVSGRARSTR